MLQNPLPESCVGLCITFCTEGFPKKEIKKHVSQKHATIKTNEKHDKKWENNLEQMHKNT